MVLAIVLELKRALLEALVPPRFSTLGERMVAATKPDLVRVQVFATVRGPACSSALFCYVLFARRYNLCKSVKVLPSSGNLPLSVARCIVLCEGAGPGAEAGAPTCSGLRCLGTGVYIQFALDSYETLGIELNTSNLVFRFCGIFMFFSAVTSSKIGKTNHSRLKLESFQVWHLHKESHQVVLGWNV